MGCGGAQFSEAPGGSDGGRGDAAGGSDAPSIPPCAPLPPTATDVYVDQSFVGTPQTGAQACPLHTIAEGLTAAASLSGVRTVHVAGAAGGVTYKEASPLTVGAKIVLMGDGPAKTTLTASGSCGSTTCAAIVGAGGVLDGFTVTCASGSGIVTGVAAPAAIVRNVAANGSMANGILALGSAELGPNIAVSGNGTGGVESPSGASGVIHVIGTSNAFDDNKGNGIDLSGAATLNFEGGTASGNFQGIRLGGAAAGGHTIASLTATGNTGPGGVVAYGGQTIKMRSSTLLGNAGVGFLYTYANGSTLDIGASAADPGNNTFAGATAAMHDKSAGLRLCNAGGAGSLTAYGNRWSACPPSQSALACGSGSGAYADVLYGSTVTTGVGAPVVAGGCTTGP